MRAAFLKSLGPSTGVERPRGSPGCQDAGTTQRLARQRREPERAEPGGSHPPHVAARGCAAGARRLNFDADLAVRERLLDDPAAGQPAVQSDSRRTIRGQVPEPCEERAFRTAREQDRAVIARERERAPFEQRARRAGALGRVLRGVVPAAADLTERAPWTIGRTGRADGGSELHQRLVELGGAPPRQESGGNRPRSSSSVAPEPEHARKNARNIA